MNLYNYKTQQVKQAYHSICLTFQIQPIESLFKEQQFENELDVSQANLDSKHFQALLQVLKQFDYFRIIKCQNNNLTNEALEYLNTFIKEGNLHVQTIYLNNNKIKQDDQLFETFQLSVQASKSLLTVFTDFGTFSNFEMLGQNGKSISAYKQAVIKSIQEIDLQLAEFQTQSSSESIYQKKQQNEASNEKETSKVQLSEKQMVSKGKQLLSQNIISYGAKKDIQLSGYCNKYYAFKAMNQDYQEYLQCLQSYTPNENIFRPNLSLNTAILNLRNQSISGFSQEIIKYSCLLTVCLAENQLSSIPKLPSQIKVSYYIQALELKKNRIKVISNLESLVQLKQLDLSYNLITEINNLYNLKQLKELNLGFNQIQQIENMEHLKITHLSLEVNQLSQFISIRPISYNASLSFLALLGNPIAEDQFYVGQVRSLLPKLQVLDYFKLNNVNNGPSFRYKLDPVKYFFSEPFLKKDRDSPQNRIQEQFNVNLMNPIISPICNLSFERKKFKKPQSMSVQKKPQSKQNVSLRAKEYFTPKGNIQQTKKQNPKKQEKSTNDSLDQSKQKLSNLKIQQNLKKQKLNRSQSPINSAKNSYSQEKLIQALKNQKLFQGLPLKFLLALTKFLKIREFSQNEIIKEQGEINDDMFILVQGKIGCRKQKQIYKELEP